MASGAAAEGRISPIHTEVARAGTSACPHDNIAIVTPQICAPPYYSIECRDCGMTRKYAPSGNKTRAETIAEIQAMLKTEREQTT